jgi:hypothetical protein
MQMHENQCIKREMFAKLRTVKYMKATATDSESSRAQTSIPFSSCTIPLLCILPLIYRVDTIFFYVRRRIDFEQLLK